MLERVATVDAATAELLKDADSLTPFGVEARDPSDAPEVLQSGETEAIGMARVVRKTILSLVQPDLDAE